MGDPRKISDGQRRQMIAEAAYFRAERRGFAAGDPVADWVEAEAEIDAQLGAIDGARLLERLEHGLASATKKLGAIKRRASSLAADTRHELARDVENLDELRKTLRAKIKELREQGEEAGQHARRQAERVWNELSDAMQRLGSRVSH